MKIEEDFYTLSKTELKWLCKKFSTAYNHAEFLIFYENEIKSLLSQKRISLLNFGFYIDKNDLEHNNE